MTISIPSKWIIGLEPEKAKDFTEILSHSNILVDRIKDILKQTLLSLEDAEENEKNFLAPEYMVRQAYILGRKKEVKQLLKLFDFRTKESK
jgi:uncharacterized protein (DUF1015 family)